MSQPTTTACWTGQQLMAGHFLRCRAEDSPRINPKYPSLRHPSLRHPSLRHPSLRYSSLRHPPFVIPPFVIPPFFTFPCLLYNLQPLLAATNSSSDAPSHSKVSLPSHSPATPQPQDISHSASSNLPRPSFKPSPTVRHSGMYERTINTVLI